MAAPVRQVITDNYRDPNRPASLDGTINSVKLCFLTQHENYRIALGQPKHKVYHMVEHISMLFIPRLATATRCFSCVYGNLSMLLLSTMHR